MRSWPGPGSGQFRFFCSMRPSPTKIGANAVRDMGGLQSKKKVYPHDSRSEPVIAICDGLLGFRQGADQGTDHGDVSHESATGLAPSTVFVRRSHRKRRAAELPSG